MNFRIAQFMFLLLPYVSCAQAELRRYELDPVHTRIVFACDHLGFSYALGSFARPQGELWFDPEDWRSARLEVIIDISTLELGDADWRERMLRRDFFHAKKFPQARFVSTRIEALDRQRARVTGDLNLRGKTRPITLEVRLNKLGRHPYTFKDTAGFSATTTLKRSEYGMLSLPNVVGDEVELRIEAEAVRLQAKGNF